MPGVRVVRTKAGGPQGGLRGVAANIRAGFADAMKAIAEMLRTHVSNNFRGQHDSWGNAWAPLSGVTVYRRIAHRNAPAGPRQDPRRVFNARGSLTRRATRMLSPGGIKILIHTANLSNSIFGRSEPYGAFVLVAGAAKRYGWVQQWGNPTNRMFGRGLAPIPARPFLPATIKGGKHTTDLPPEVLDEAKRIVLAAMLRRIKEPTSMTVSQQTRLANAWAGVTRSR